MALLIVGTVLTAYSVYHVSYDGAVDMLTLEPYFPLLFQLHLPLLAIVAGYHFTRSPAGQHEHLSGAAFLLATVLTLAASLLPAIVILQMQEIEDAFALIAKIHAAVLPLTAGALTHYFRRTE